MKHKATLSLVVLAAASLATAYALWFHPDEFPRNVRAMFDSRRLNLLLGEDVSIYDACYETQFAGEDCWRWRLPATRLPEYWPNPDLPPPKWPAPPKERVYQAGMDRVEYFNALCKSEAGEFITKTVKAEGIYMIRPRSEESEKMISSRYELEDPYGYGQGDVGDEGPYTFPGPLNVYGSMAPHYRWVETPTWNVGIHRSRQRYYHPGLFETPPHEADIRLFEIPPQMEKWPDGMGNFMEVVAVSYSASPKSRFGYTWRGIRRPYDREFGIAGGELIVVDLATNEILGLRRGFMLASRLVGGGISWLTGRACPFYSQMPPEASRGRRYDKDVDYTRMFMTKVVVPEYRYIAEGKAR